MGRRLAVRYFVAQAVAIAAWWAGLATIPSAWAWFTPTGVPRESLVVFAPGDISVVIASFILAWGKWRPWATPLAWSIAGGMTYATICTLAATMIGTATALSSLLMVAAAIASVVAAAAMTRDPSPSAVSRSAIA